DSSPLPGGTQTPGTPPTSAEASAAQRALGNVLGNRAAAGALAAGAGKPDVAAGGTRQTPTQLPPQVAPMIELIRAKNPYRLSRDGMLALPGFAPIPLAGLTEQLATLRLGVEPALRDLFIRVTKLPLEKIGTTALKPFGYELFDRQISTFAPATDVPVPAHYIVGPGDELAVQLYGNKNASYRLIVGRNGLVNFPQVGPIGVAGETFENVKAGVEARIERQMIGVRASVSMGEIRSETSVADVVQLAGGLTPEADTAKLALTRIDADLHRVVLQVDLSSAAGKAEAVRNGDSLRVSRLRPTLDAGVQVQGYVYTTGAFPYREGMRLTDMIRSVDDLRPNADLHYVLIRRELPPDGRVTALSADLAAALREPGSPADVPLMALDRIMVFD